MRDCRNAYLLPSENTGQAMIGRSHTFRLARPTPGPAWDRGARGSLRLLSLVFRLRE